MSDSTFIAFVNRIRAGDELAAEELVRKYEPLIRREVRLKLEDRRLTQLFDSMDVCQSVLKSFFIRTAAGEYDLHDPAQLIGLLVSMTRNKLASDARKEHQKKRDRRRITGSDEDLAETPASDNSPSQIIENRDLLNTVRLRMTEEERKLADLRGLGHTWDEIATQCGGKAHARRVQFTRALNRVARELDIDGGEDD